MTVLPREGVAIDTKVRLNSFCAEQPSNSLKPRGVNPPYQIAEGTRSDLGEHYNELVNAIEDISLDQCKSIYLVLKAGIVAYRYGNCSHRVAIRRQLCIRFSTSSLGIHQSEREVCVSSALNRTRTIRRVWMRWSVSLVRKESGCVSW